MATTFSNIKDKVHLQNIKGSDGRDIFFSTTDATATATTPVLFFYPLGGNRRMIASWIHHLPASSLLICVNRPGKGGTSPPPRMRIKSRCNSHSASSSAERVLTTALQDIITVLDYLHIDRVSVLCLCAGCAFGMAFCARHPERTNGHLLGISSWVEPVDCGYENTTFPFYLGSSMPLLASPIVGAVACSIGASMTSLPESWINHAMRGKLSKEEQQAFDKKYGGDQQPNEFMEQMTWMQEETGGARIDVSVLFTGGHIDYNKLDETHKVTLYHGSNDRMVPLASAEWLIEEVFPTAILNVIPDGSHEGLMFGLHSSVLAGTKEALGL